MAVPSIQELREIAQKHLEKASECNGSDREFELYLARAYTFLADDEERVRGLLRRPYRGEAARDDRNC
jgi:hypothetical protein